MRKSLLVAVYQLGQRGTRAVVACNSLPLWVTSKLWKYLRDMLTQFVAFRWRKRANRVLDLLGRAHAVTVSVGTGTGKRFEKTEVRDQRSAAAENQPNMIPQSRKYRTP